MIAVPIIPGYEILTCLGGGILTAVYSARAHDTDAACVVKLLRSDWQDQPLAVKLLQREARACLAVTHRHLVKLVDTHVLTSPHFLVMEMLPGESLRSRLKRDYSLNVQTALWIARQTAEALAALHKKGFMHGDVKPDNIRLIGDGNAILLDLGFAHQLGENASLMEAGYIMGTVDYLAPELCGPEPSDDARSDFFSLGMTLFEMLTGRLPYSQGSVVDTLHRHHHERPADIGSYIENVPAGLQDLLGRLLAPEPRRRPSAARLVQELIGLEIAALARRRVA
jgi:eukaryotic-like serine/threonine-protein kinase